MSAITKTRMRRIKEELPLPKRKRIPVSKVYWKKGDYKELVEDPYNLN